MGKCETVVNNKKVIVPDIMNAKACKEKGTCNGASGVCTHTWVSNCKAIPNKDENDDIKDVKKMLIEDKIRLEFTASGRNGGAEIYHRKSDVEFVKAKNEWQSLDRWSVDNTRIYYGFKACPPIDRLGKRPTADPKYPMTLYDPDNKPMVDFNTKVYVFVRVNRLQDSECTVAEYTFARAAQPDIYPGTSTAHILASLPEKWEAKYVSLPVQDQLTDVSAVMETSPDIYNGARYRDATMGDSKSDENPGVHFMSETSKISMSTRTAEADVWYKLDISTASGLNDGIISKNDKMKTAGVKAQLPNPLNPKFIVDPLDPLYSGGEANYHAEPGSCATQTGGTVDASTEKECEVDKQVMANKTYVKIAKGAGKNCGSADTDLGGGNAMNTVAQCAAACAAVAGDCKFFIFGTGPKKGRCKFEKTATEVCSEGFVSDNYDFYQTAGNTWTPPTNPAGPFKIYMSTVVTAVAISKDARACAGYSEQLGEKACLAAKTRTTLGCKFTPGSAQGRACQGTEQQCKDVHAKIAKDTEADAKTKCTSAANGKCTYVSGVLPKCRAALADSEPTTVAYIVQVEPVKCGNPANQVYQGDGLNVPLTTPTEIYGQGKQKGMISYKIPNTAADQNYNPKLPPILYEGTDFKTYAVKPNLQQSPYTFCKYCIKFATPYYFSEQYYGWYDRTKTPPSKYPAIYPADLGGAAEGAVEDPPGGTNDKGVAIMINQRSTIDKFPSSQKPTPSTGDVYVTQDACCDKVGSPTLQRLFSCWHSPACMTLIRIRRISHAARHLPTAGLGRRRHRWKHDAVQGRE